MPGVARNRDKHVKCVLNRGDKCRLCAAGKGESWRSNQIGGRGGWHGYRGRCVRGSGADGRRPIRAMATDQGHGGRNGEEGINVRCI